jgi:hypothetical protein
MKESHIIGVDFDGTCTSHEYPRIGKDIGAVPVLKKLVANSHQLIIFTMRSGKELEEAVKWFKKNEIPLYGINTNPTQLNWTSSPKAYCHLFIDDASLFAPLKQDYKLVPVAMGIETTTYGNNSKEVPVGRPYLDWVKVEEELIRIGLI